jgi:hypothetical protein
LDVAGRANTHPSDGVNMVRFLLYTALALNFSAPAVTATDRYGGWLLEQPRSFVLTPSFKQSVQLNNKIKTLELGFICDQRKNPKSVGVILIPFDGTFQSERDVIPVLIQNHADQYDPSDLLQNWKNGVEYISLEAKDDVDDLASFMRANEMDGAKSSFLQTVLLRVLKHQTTSLLMCRGFPIVSMRSEWHAPRPNRIFSGNPRLSSLRQLQ